MAEEHKVYANIVCDAAGRPYELIITDGEHTDVIPVKNSSVKTCRRTAKQIYNASVIFISHILGDK